MRAQPAFRDTQGVRVWSRDAAVVRPPRMSDRWRRVMARDGALVLTTPSSG